MTRLSPLALMLTAAVLWAAPLAAATWRPGSDAELADALAGAAAGDEIILREGRWTGPLVIDKPLVLRGEPGAVVDGRGVVQGVLSIEVISRFLHEAPTDSRSGADLVEDPAA